MHATSAASLAAAEKELGTQLASASDAMRVAEDFFGLADILRDNGPLKRALTDNGRDAADRQALVESLLASHVTPQTLDVVKVVAGSEWSDPDDLREACEVLGIIATMTDAKRAGQLKDVEGEIFGVQQLFASDRDLRMQLSDFGFGDPHDRAALSDKLLGDKVTKWTKRLVHRAVGRSQHGHLLANLRRYEARASEIEGQQLVTIVSASELSAAQVERLGAVLEKRLGRPVMINSTIEEGLVGGFRMLLGTTSVDASIATQVRDLKRELAH